MTSPLTIADMEKHTLETIATIKGVAEMSDEQLMTTMRGFFSEHNKGKITVIRRQTSSSYGDDGEPDARDGLCVLDARDEGQQTNALPRLQLEQLPRARS